MEPVRTNYATTARTEPSTAASARASTAGAQAGGAPAAAAVAAPVPGNAPTPDRASQKESRQQLQALLDQVGERLQPELRALSFRVNDDIDGVVVSVIDTETDELVRQIPAETMVRLAKALEQLDASTGNAGLLLTEKA